MVDDHLLDVAPAIAELQSVLQDLQDCGGPHLLPDSEGRQNLTYPLIRFSRYLEYLLILTAFVCSFSVI